MSESANSEATADPKSRRVKAILVALAGLVVVVLHGLGNAADDADVAGLGFLSPVRSAEGLANEAVVLASAENFDAAVETGKAAVRRLPVQQSTVRKLGEIELAGEASDAWANDTIRTSDLLGWRDSPAQARLLMMAAQDGDITGAIDHIDAVLRRTELSEEVFRAISAGIANEEIRSRMVTRLSQDPPWRLDLLKSVDDFGDSQSAQNFAQMVLELSEREGGSLASEEVAPVLSRLAALDLSGPLLAAAERLEPVTMFQQGINDPQFSGLREGARDPDAAVSPFEWKRGRAQSIVVTVGSREGVDDALNIRSRSRVRGVILIQTLRLNPGPYQLNYSKLGSRSESEGLEWRVLCAGETIDTPQNAAASGGGWQAQTLPFTVPANCPIQRVELRTGRNLRGETRRASYSDLSITPS